jgi:RNA polymerase sigma factor (sigma-70 family)
VARYTRAAAHPPCPIGSARYKTKCWVFPGLHRAQIGETLTQMKPTAEPTAAQVAEDKPAIADRAQVLRWLSGARIFFLRHAPGQDGDDLAHEAVTVLLEAIQSGQLRERERAGGFLLGTCRNLVSRNARADQRRDRALLRVVEPEAEEPTHRLDARRLWECFNQLSARSRSVLERSFVHDEDSAAIGGALRMTEGNVRVVRHRALESLRVCVEDPS